MIIIFGLLFLIMLLTINVHWEGIDSQYLSKNYTLSIKGVFVIIVFLSHVRAYTEFTSSTDIWVIEILDYLGQLMVAMFLFYSGYGIYESIKRKGKAYIDSFPKNRIARIYLDFLISILLFVVLGLFLEKHYSFMNTLLAFTGWTSIGNSAWYMFTIFVLYILTYICFKIARGYNLFAIVAITILSLGYIYFMSFVKGDYWLSTYLCYVLGVWYSYYKEKIDGMLQKYNILYYILFAFIIISYLTLFDLRYKCLLMFNCVSILFCLLIVFLSMKISFKSQILSWLGEHLFWMYFLQRLPMNVFEYLKLTEYNPYIFMFFSLIVTIILSYYMRKCSQFLQKICFKSV